MNSKYKYYNLDIYKTKSYEDINNKYKYKYYKYKMKYIILDTYEYSKHIKLYENNLINILDNIASIKTDYKNYKKYMTNIYNKCIDLFKNKILPLQQAEEALTPAVLELKSAEDALKIVIQQLVTAQVELEKAYVKLYLLEQPNSQDTSTIGGSLFKPITKLFLKDNLKETEKSNKPEAHKPIEYTFKPSIDTIKPAKNALEQVNYALKIVEEAQTLENMAHKLAVGTRKLAFDPEKKALIPKEIKIEKIKIELDYNSFRSSMDTSYNRKRDIINYIRSKLKSEKDEAYIDCERFDNGSNDKCSNFFIIHDNPNSDFIIGFGGSNTLNDIKIDINKGSNYIHRNIFTAMLKFLFRDNMKLYDKIKEILDKNKTKDEPIKIYFCGGSLGSGFAIYMLIFFRYILNENNLYAIVLGTLPVIPPFLNDYISKYIISISHEKDPIYQLSIVVSSYNLEIPKNTYFIKNKENDKETEFEQRENVEYKNNIITSFISKDFDYHIKSLSLDEYIYNEIIKSFNSKQNLI